MVGAMYDKSFFPWSPWLTPEKAREELNTLEQRMSPPNVPFLQYLDALQANGQAQCTTVWTKGTVAYRCRTCQVNDSSAICEGCFLEGEHKKHDYVMYHSDSGGCCDCGDLEAWKFEGFCSAHRCVDRQEPSVPSELELPSKKSVREVFRMVSLVLVYISEMKGEAPVSREKLIETAIVFLDWLKQLCSLDALRKIVCGEVVQMTLRDRKTLDMMELVSFPLLDHENLKRDRILLL